MAAQGVNVQAAGELEVTQDGGNKKLIHTDIALLNQAFEVRGIENYHFERKNVGQLSRWPLAPRNTLLCSKRICGM